MASAVAGQTETMRIATEFVQARLAARPLAQFPGTLPADLDAAYRVQDAAIALWPTAVVGWKVGWIPEPFASRYGEERLVGPIFSCSLREARGSHAVETPVYAGGFAAIEGEFVFRLAHDAPPDRVDWTPESAAALVAGLHLGMEIASSPLATINDLGAAAIVSDFGNNAGLVLGPEIPDWRARDPATLICECRIDGRTVGRGGAASLPGGPLAALAFALQRNARRGRPLRAGQLITTGASTGVHVIAADSIGEARFGGLGVVTCRARAATPIRLGKDTRG